MILAEQTIKYFIVDQNHRVPVFAQTRRISAQNRMGFHSQHFWDHSLLSECLTANSFLCQTSLVKITARNKRINWQRNRKFNYAIIQFMNKVCFCLKSDSNTTMIPEIPFSKRIRLEQYIYRPVRCIHQTISAFPNEKQPALSLCLRWFGLDTPTRTTRLCQDRVFN